MKESYYSKQSYNKLKKNQCEECIKSQKIYNEYFRKKYKEYIEGQISYYINMNKYYQSYIKKRNVYNLYTKRKYEEYIRKQNNEYINMKNYYENYIRKQNNYYICNIKNNRNIFRKHSSLIKSYKEHNRAIGNSQITDKEKNNNLLEVRLAKERNFKDIKINKTNEVNEFSIINRSKIDEKVNYLNYDLEKKNLINSNIKEVSHLNYNFKENSLEKSEERLETTKEQVKENNFKFKNNNYLRDDYKKDCELVKVKSVIIPFSEENNNKSIVLNQDNLQEESFRKIDESGSENLYVKLPVVLSEANITIHIEDTIKLNQEVKDIKRIKRKLYLTESRLIPYSQNIDKLNSGILFVNGFIRKDIEYKTEAYKEDVIDNICGDIRRCIAEVPFKFSTRISFLTPPIFIKDVSGSRVFNENPFIELVKTTFNEMNIIKRTNLNYEDSMNKKSTQIVENLLLSIGLQVLQKQELSMR